MAGERGFERDGLASGDGGLEQQQGLAAGGAIGVTGVRGIEGAGDLVGVDDDVDGFGLGLAQAAFAGAIGAGIDQQEGHAG